MMLIWPNHREHKLGMVALRLRTNASPDLPAPLPRLDDHPGYARLASMRRGLLTALSQRQREIDLAALEAELRSPSGGSARGPRAEMLRQHAQALRGALPAAVEPPQPTDGLSSAIVAGLSLAAGEKVTPPQDRPARLQQLRSEILILEAAHAEVDTLMEQVKAEQTFETAQILLPAHRAALASIFRAAVALAEAMEHERSFIVSMINGGYDQCEWVLWRPYLPGAVRIGHLDHWDSELNNFRRALEKQGVLR